MKIVLDKKKQGYNIIELKETNFNKDIISSVKKDANILINDIKELIENNGFSWDKIDLSINGYTTIKGNHYKL